MDSSLWQVKDKLISGRELFVCDGAMNQELILHTMQRLQQLHYTRSEASRSGTEVSGSAAEVPERMIENETLFEIIRNVKEKFFPGEPCVRQRVYVNYSVFGDMYYPHRDARPTEKNVTVLYYANPVWNKDWGGETVFFNDDEDAEIAVLPRPGRILAFRGAILHRGGVPLRICYKERLALAYKFKVST
jgi:SM-20-related protein